MNLLWIFYYYYYLFYTKILREEHPHFTVVFTLSFVESLWINGLMDAIFLTAFCYKLSKWMMICVALVLMGINYWYYHRKHDANKVLEVNKSRFKRSGLALTVLLFSIVGVLWMFLGSFYAKHLLEICQ